MHKEAKLGPIGKGFVAEIKTQAGTRYVARWNAYVMDGDTRKRIQCGPYEVGPKVSHGPGLKSIADAKKEWDKVYWSVFERHYPLTATPQLNPRDLKASASMKVKDFITSVWEPRRSPSLEENSKLNWEYYRDSFIVPFFGNKTLAEMNNESLVRKFMQGVADREFSDWTAKKCYTYTKALLDMSRDLGITTGNAARLIPKALRIPKGVKKAHSQPFISIDEYSRLLAVIERPRDRIIMKILFFCAVRRSELFVFKWQDFRYHSGMYVLNVCRSFESRTHKVKEWDPANKAHGKVVVPPKLAAEIQGWRNFGDTHGDDPNSYIFPTRNGRCIIPTNWVEDVLKPAGEKIGLPGVSLHQFRRGHATVQHGVHVGDKAIQGQLRHSKASTTRDVYMQQVDPETLQAVVDLEMLVEAKVDQKTNEQASHNG
jgi:integrase